MRQIEAELEDAVMMLKNERDRVRFDGKVNRRSRGGGACGSIE